VGAGGRRPPNRFRGWAAPTQAFLGWEGASWPRPLKSHGKKLKIVKKEN